MPYAIPAAKWRVKLRKASHVRSEAKRLERIAKAHANRAKTFRASFKPSDPPTEGDIDLDNEATKYEAISNLARVRADRKATLVVALKTK